MPDQLQKTIEPDAPWARKEPFESGPRSLREGVPDTSNILKKLRTTDPNMAKRYRQRSGQ